MEKGRHAEETKTIRAVMLLTPLTTFVPTLVTKPLTLSDLRDDRTRVDPGSLGARRAMHSSRPSFSDASES